MKDCSPSVLGVIPARFGSTRFPGKPLIPILGKTLVQRTYENSKQCALLDEVVVATDDQRIFDHVKAFGGNVVMTSVECPTGSDRLAEVVTRYPEYSNADIVVNIQGDEPCLNPKVIEKAVQALFEDPSAVVSTAATPLSPHDDLGPNCVKCVMDTQGRALYFSRSLIPGSRSGSFDPMVKHYKHVGLYVFRKEFLLKYGQLPATPLQQAEDLEQLKILEHGFTLKVAVVDYINLEINVPEDIQKVERELCRQNTSS